MVGLISYLYFHWDTHFCYDRMLNTEQDPDVSSLADNFILRKGRKKKRLIMTSLREEESSCMPFNYEARKEGAKGNQWHNRGSWEEKVLENSGFLDMLTGGTLLRVLWMEIGKLLKACVHSVEVGITYLVARSPGCMYQKSASRMGVLSFPLSCVGIQMPFPH